MTLKVMMGHKALHVCLVKFFYFFLIVSPTLHEQASCGTITAAEVLANVSGACHTSINEERGDNDTCKV